MTSNVQRIAEEVKALPREQLDEFLAWLADYESERMDDWDNEIARDCRPEGRLHDVLKKAESDIATGEIKPLDEILDHN